MDKLLNGLEMFLDNLLKVLPRYILGIIVLIAGLYLVKTLTKIIARRFVRRDLDKSLSGFLQSLIKTILYIILFVIVIGIAGFKSMSLTAIFGAAGLTIGLALQGSLSNFAGGVLILLFRPFQVGDYITNSGGTVGTVEKIDLLYTTLTNDDGLRVFSPNGPLANSVITNYSEITVRRYSFGVRVSYTANLKTVRDVILKALNQHKDVLETPAPLVYVKNLAESSVDLSIVIWIDKKSYWGTVFEIQQVIKDVLDEANIKIPFPQTEMHIVSEQKKTT